MPQKVPGPRWGVNGGGAPAGYDSGDSYRAPDSYRRNVAAM
jgi:hypothetical protein